MEDTFKIVPPVEVVVDDPTTDIRLLMTLMLTVIIQSDIERLKEILGPNFDTRLKEIGVDLDMVNEVESYDTYGDLTEIDMDKVHTLYDTMSRHFRFEENLLY